MHLVMPLMMHQLANIPVAISGTCCLGRPRHTERSERPVTVILFGSRLQRPEDGPSPRRRGRLRVRLFSGRSKQL